MSLYIISVIFILLLIAISVVWFTSYKNEKMIHNISDKLAALKIDDLEKIIIELKNIQFTGASLESYESESNEFQNIVDLKIPEIQEKLSTAKTQNYKLKVFAAKKNNNQTLVNLENVSNRIDSIFENLNKLSESTKINASRAEELKSVYEETRKKVLAKSFNYGPAAKSLENELTELDKMFENVNSLTETGDHLEAKNEINKIKTELEKIDNQMINIEPLYNELNDTFPSQIEEINSVYKKLKVQRYDFSKPGIIENIKHISNSIDDSKEKLANLDFESVEIDNKSIAIEIDQLYGEIEKEINAKKFVDAEKQVVLEFIKHAKNQNRILNDDLKEVSQKYILTNNEIENTNDFRKEIDESENQFNHYSEDMAMKSVVFSEIADFYKELKKKLTDIEEKQKNIHENLSGIYEGEAIAKTSVEKFDNTIEKQKRIVAQLRLKGLPQDYIEYFNMVTNEIDKMEANLNAPKVNVEDISKQLIIVQEDLNNLEQRTKDLIKNVRLSENLIQYSNKYIESNTEIKEAAEKARNLYENNYDYEGAIKEISQVLDKVEPGAVKRLEDSIDA